MLQSQHMPQQIPQDSQEPRWYCTGARETGIYPHALTSRRMQVATRKVTLFMEEGLSTLPVSLGVRVSVPKGDQDSASWRSVYRMC